jgi:hypothetical protein
MSTRFPFHAVAAAVLEVLPAVAGAPRRLTTDKHR